MCRFVFKYSGHGFCVRKCIYWNCYIDKYSSYDTGFHAHASFSLWNGSVFDKNLKIFGTNISSLVHTENRKKDRKKERYKKDYW